MTRATDRFDADGHVFEDDAGLLEHLSPPYRGRKELLRDPLFPPMDRWNRTAMSIAGGHRTGTATGRVEGTPERWLEVLDANRIDTTVLYPTYGLSAGLIRDVPWALSLARGYNDWLHATFLSASPRLKGVALLPLQDPPAAAEELRRAVTELGMVGGVLPASGLRRGLGDPIYSPIYEAAQDLGVPVAVHAGASEGMGLDILDTAVQARCLGHPLGQIIQMTHMMFSGVFDRFPHLRFGFMEAGVSWILFLMQRMERAHEMWGFQAPELKATPRAHLTSGRIFFHCEIDEEVLPRAVETLGEHTLFYASDYPHDAPEGVAADLADFEARPDISASTKTLVLGDNGRRFYGLT
jgi:hypothetical protein